MDSSKEVLLEKINFAIAQLRPFLNDDGGDMELVEMTNDGTVKVRLLGACSDCSMSSMTLKAGLEETLLSISPEIKRIEAVQ